MKNYNIHYLKGHKHITDAIFAEKMGLPLEYIGTPQINCNYEGSQDELNRYYANAGLLEVNKDE